VISTPIARDPEISLRVLQKSFGLTILLNGQVGTLQRPGSIRSNQVEHAVGACDPNCPLRVLQQSQNLADFLFSIGGKQRSAVPGLGLGIKQGYSTGRAHPIFSMPGFQKVVDNAVGQALIDTISCEGIAIEP
jgi:hypothetical protein